MIAIEIKSFLNVNSDEAAQGRILVLLYMFA